MTMLQHGLVPSTGGYQIERSLRFNSADSAYLNRTPASAGNQKTWTWSAWVKKSTLGAYQTLFGQGTGNVNVGYGFIRFDNTDTFTITASPDGATSSIGWTSTPVYRDPSAWYHVVAVLDTTQATAANRFVLYINGVSQAGSFSTTPTQNADIQINRASAHQIGAQNASSLGNYLSSYLADVYFIDGSALTPSSFGETDTDTGVWKPKAYSGSYGTNGFYLKFADNSGTTSTTLGKDSSGNGNNWTPNNFSVTAGAGNDSLVDTPTPYGTDTGVGGEVRGNYCTLNPLDHVGGTFSNGNLDVVVALANTSIAVGNFAVSSGKWYWEVTPTAMTDAAAMIGVADSSKAISDRRWTTANGWVYAGYNGQKFNNSSGASYGATFANNDVIGVALNMDDGSVTFYKNGSSQGVAYNTGLSGKTIQPMLGNATTNGSQTCVFNFGQRPFAYTAPSGFKALCTQNLPTPTIGATATTRADDYFNTVLWSGNDANPRTITGVGFQPDFVWIKNRNAATYNFLHDAVRGVTSTDSRSLVSNATDAETNYYTTNGGVTAFTSDGFTTSGGTANANLNLSGRTFVAWNWKANGAGSSNTSGTITSTVSANTTAGFSVVTYTGNGTVGATRGHGLGVAPDMIFVKGRSGTYGTDNWHVYHSALGNTGGLFLNLTDAFTTSSFFWNNTSPSSTVFTTSSGSSNNGSGTTYVAYCFAAVAGYSAFGSYTGNGVSDGPFIYTGFRPAFILIKVSSNSGRSWVLVDAKRSTYNVSNANLYPNLSDAEATTQLVDILSNGFKIRNDNTGNAVFTNDTNQTHIYAAFAENPFKYSLAR